MGKNKKKTELAASGEKLICQNRKVFHKNAIGERLEAGLMLCGTEVKACREGNAHLNDAFVQVIAGEAYLEHSYFGEYRQGNQFNHDTNRTRKLLLHGREIESSGRKSGRRVLRWFPSRCTSSVAGQSRSALAKGKDREDKRETLRSPYQAQMEKVMKGMKRRWF